MKLNTLLPSRLAALFLLLCSLNFDRCASYDGQLEHEHDDHLGVEGKESTGVEPETGAVLDSGDFNTDEDSGSISTSEDEDTEPPKSEDLYFYLFDNESVVTEFEPPSNKEEKEEPDFLFKPLPGRIRIVEFYAHWCPHCGAFRQTYNAFAKKMKEIAEQNKIQLDVYAISCVPHRKLCRELDINSYPKIKLYTGSFGVEEEAVEFSYSDLHPFIVLQVIAEKMGNDLSPALTTLRENEEQYENEEKNNGIGLAHNNSSFWLPRTKRDIYNDIYLSFYFAMQHSIFVGRDPPSDEARSAFQNWIILLDQVLPPIWRLKALVSDIADNIETVLNSEDNLLHIVDRYPPPKKKWSQSCSRGDSAMGYTCGLWQLFHTVTIGVVEWNLAGSEELSYTPMEVGDIFRSYIEQFFGCEVCRVNFLNEYDTCGFSRCDRLNTEIGSLDDWKELPLWLFELHNGVNLRLMNERAKRDDRTPTQQELDSVEWPARRDCPSCWHSDGRFELDAIYSFFQLTYWPDELLSNVQMRKILSTTGNTAQLQTNEEETIESWVYSLVGFVVASFVLSAVSWSVEKQREIRRTGKHKKADDDNDIWS
mmetsp:Transcript_3546/g.7639  ORF Transcript_3546/g.7639 Transcript_3546/m.7639 type:complete len:592 (-) Transcript_3546:432-2207(-)